MLRKLLPLLDEAFGSYNADHESTFSPFVSNNPQTRTRPKIVISDELKISLDATTDA